jgi:uncharacterized membrane protein YgcG
MRLHNVKSLTRIQNILEDFYILILPISTVWSLQMSMRRKIGVLSVIAFGSSSVVIACFRLIPLFQLNSSPDTSWVLGIMVIVAALEIQFAVIAVNLPSLKALWMRHTGGSSSGYTPENSKKKAYRLSSMERKGGRNSSTQWGTGGRSKGSRGSITMLERGITSTESEEELFRQGGTSLHLPVKVKEDENGVIRVTSEVDIQTSEDQKKDTVAQCFLRNH